MPSPSFCRGERHPFRNGLRQRLTRLGVRSISRADCSELLQNCRARLYEAAIQAGVRLTPQLPTFEQTALSGSQLALAKLAQREDGLPVRRSADLKALLATEARRLERAQASFRLRATLSIDFDLTITGVTAVHPLLCSENTSA
jgi:hypothetical protein